VQIESGDHDLRFVDGKREVARFRKDDVPFKPYVDRLLTPGGVNVLRDSPSDHKHHHALMFAVAADKVNFWEEVTKPGRQIVRGPVETKVDSSTAKAVANLDWLAADDKVLLQEKRRIDVPQTKDLGATLLIWETRLQPPSGKDSTTLTGAHYHGLGMRFVESMDKGGTFFNASKKEGTIVRGDETLTPAPWSAYTAEADGKPVTVAMFDHPSNPRPALWFTMSTPFAYLSATMNYWKEPLTVKSEKPAVMRYAVAVWDGRVETQTIDSLYKRWIATPWND
jgi:hypothetical protein